MWNCSGIGAALTTVSAIALCQSAVAETISVPFEGNVPIQATIVDVNPGTVEIPTTGTSGGNTKVIESFTPATVTVQSNTPANITVEAPTLVSGPTSDPAGTTHIGFLKVGSTEIRSDMGEGTIPLPLGQTDLEVNMLVERPESFAPGTYTYVVTLTITP